MGGTNKYEGVVNDGSVAVAEWAGLMAWGVASARWAGLVAYTAYGTWPWPSGRGYLNGGVATEIWAGVIACRTNGSLAKAEWAELS